ncbi:DUF2059 domain-containing protein [Marinobacter lipolyticus]|mgnify:FL=1|uniref:DUF2059 domain-containing protein n=1 Tax=Marinobacter lipolyticus TaxID=209639 RepID=UPI001BCFE888|nr:DUF2059 domain-containing protein [Marinobacter lipolyticus]MBS8240956.1 DUF2059 domain-containing protein [Marinobacter lipolyticus]
MKAFSQIKPVLVSVALLWGTAQAAPSADAVLDASPIDDIVAQYPAMMSQGIRDGLKRSGRVPPFAADTIGHMVSSSFNARDIQAQIVADLESNLSEAQLQSVMDWYDTPLAQKIAEAEIAASRPEAWAEIQAQAPALNKRFRGSERVEMFDRFDNASRATESAVDTSIAVQSGLATALSALKGADAASFEQIQAQIENQRGMLEGMVNQQVFDSYLFTYRDISASELDLYIRFLESDAGARFSGVVTNSIQRAITAPIESIGNQMVRFLNPAS